MFNPSSAIAARIIEAFANRGQHYRQEGHRTTGGHPLKADFAPSPPSGRGRDSREDTLLSLVVMVLSIEFNIHSAQAA